MKKLLAILMTAVLSVAACMGLTACGGNGDEITLQVYTNAGFAPFEYVSTEGKVVGVDIDIMNEIGKQLGYKIVINDIEFKQIFSEIQKSKYAVGAAGISKKADRDEIANASIVYATSVQYIIAPVGTFEANAIVTLEQIVAVTDKVGVQEGTTGQYLLEDYLDENEALTDTTFKYKNAILASADIGSVVDAVIIDELPAKSISESNNALSCWQIENEPESYVLYFNKDATDILEKVNGVLKTMIDNGTIDQYIINHSNGN